MTMRVEFEPGTIGMGFQGNIVSEIDDSSQAARKNVIAGMIIKEVNGESVPCDTESIIAAIGKTSAINQNTVILFGEPEPNSNDIPVGNVRKPDDMEMGATGESRNKVTDPEGQVTPTRRLSVKKFSMSIPPCTPRALLIALACYIIGVVVTLIFEGIMIASATFGDYITLWYIVGCAVVISICMCVCGLWLSFGGNYTDVNLTLAGRTNKERNKALLCSAFWGIFFAVGFGIGAGITLRPTWYWNSLNVAENINPYASISTAKKIRFMKGTQVDSNAGSYQIVWDTNNDGEYLGSPQRVICAAPIRLVNNSTSNEKISYWAVNQDGCCRGYPMDRIDFTDCRWTGDGKHGIEIFNPDDRIPEAVYRIGQRNKIQVQSTVKYVEWVRDFSEVINPRKKTADELIFPIAFTWPIVFIVVVHFKDCCNN